jgi:hypothetical protein
VTEPTPAEPPRLVPRPSSWRYRAVVTVAVLAAIAALAVGVRATQTESDMPATVNGRPDVVEHLYPRNGAEVLRQVEVGVDLAAGYEGALVVNDTPIPEDELRLVPEQNQVFFTPGPGLSLETLPPGTSCVTVVAWKSSEGRGPNDLSFRWCFDVT